MLYFFLGFVVTSQIGGRILDRRGAKRPVVIGCALAAVGFGIWASKVTQLNFSSQIWPVILAGAGMGLMLTPASTDAVNRASRLSYGEATGITQTVRNYSASLGSGGPGDGPRLATPRPRDHVARPDGRAAGSGFRRGGRIAQFQSSGSGGSDSIASIPHFIRLDFAEASRTVFFTMAGDHGGRRSGGLPRPATRSTEGIGRTGRRGSGRRRRPFGGRCRRCVPRRERIRTLAPTPIFAIITSATRNVVSDAMTA